jgi:hypothetical protein
MEVRWDGVGGDGDGVEEDGGLLGRGRRGDTAQGRNKGNFGVGRVVFGSGRLIKFLSQGKRLCLRDNAAGTKA